MRSALTIAGLLCVLTGCAMAYLQQNYMIFLLFGYWFLLSRPAAQPPTPK